MTVDIPGGDDEGRVDRPTVLVVDDDNDLADTFALWLREYYDVRVSYDGESGLEQADEDVDVVLLDRRMPDRSGDEVLDEIRDDGLECQVAMLTAVEPSDDLLELPYDEYVVKPVRRAELVETVDELLVRARFDEETQEYFTAESTERLLQAHDKPELLETFRDRVEHLRDEHAAEIQRSRDRMHRLTRINSLIRDVNRALVEASTRSDLAQKVCDRIGENGPYPFCFITAYTRSTDRFSPEAVSGDGVTMDHVDDVVATDAVSDTMRSAVHDERVTHLDAPVAGLSEPLSSQGSMVCVPLVYTDTVYGALVVFHEPETTFSDVERQVLAELGDTIANAINAIEVKRMLLTDRAIELEFEVTDPRAALVDLSSETGCEFEMEGIVPSDDGVICYLHVDGAPPTSVVRTADESGVVGASRVVTDREDEGLVELDVVGDSPVLSLTDAGARVQTVGVDDGTMRLVARIASDARVRTYVDTLRTEFDESNLLAQREVDPSVDSTERFRDKLDDRLTDRQQTALAAAYNGGYFEWPRESAAEDVADTLGISSPTLHEHLRIAQRKLLDAYFDEMEK